MRRFVISILLCLPAGAADADLILHNGKIVTVDAAFHVVEAVAGKGRAHHGDRHERRHSEGGAQCRGPGWWTLAVRPCSPA